MNDLALQEVIDNLVNWAKSKDQILELWIYGSRTKGAARDQSDLDIAYLISPLAGEEMNGEFWNIVIPAWKREIKKFTPWPIHLEAKITVAEYLLESGKKIYHSTPNN